MDGVIRKFKGVYEAADRLSGGSLDILRQSVSRFTEMGGSVSAAALAYYALFSLFPLLLFLVAILSIILANSEAAYYQAISFIRNALPVSVELIEDNMLEVLKQRGRIGLISAAGLLWSASGFFSILGRSINRAWPQVKLRGFVQSRLLALGMVGGLLILLLLSLISSTLVGLLPTMVEWLGLDEQILQSPIRQVVLRVVPALFTYLMFVALYSWVPNKHVNWHAALRGAALVTVVWELAKYGFAFYIGSGLVNFEIVYGSLGTLIILMLWIYFSNFLALLGAYLVATLDQRAELALAAKSPSQPAVRAEPAPAGGQYKGIPLANVLQQSENNNGAEQLEKAYEGQGAKGTRG